MKDIDLGWLVDFIPDAALLVGENPVVVAAKTRADETLHQSKSCSRNEVSVIE
ncbi:hypothetical protein ACFOZ5_01715 [Marinobacter lacisalsi]|uniref:Uncharacterized protein n=1 Tax=Marinobacter lacisalsi TaxID=475979 RepID=A0ABV8QBM0_9GAMM